MLNSSSVASAVKEKRQPDIECLIQRKLPHFFVLRKQ